MLSIHMERVIWRLRFLNPMKKSVDNNLPGSLERHACLRGDRFGVGRRYKRAPYRVDADVAGDAPLNKKTQQIVETPHIKTSQRNLKAPNQPAYNTKGVEPVSMTQKEVRMVRKYIESLQKK